MTTPSREAAVILREQADHLAYLATELLYERQPELWELGEHGRQRTLEDFGHHFRALARGSDAFRVHVDYCYELFSGRGFPRRWLDDAWATMADTCGASLEPDPLSSALAVLAVAEEHE